MKISIYDSNVTKIGEQDLSEEIFNADYNEPLVLQVVHGLSANARSGNAHTKIRKEVSGGGRKPWQQKGLGRARHGSRRSPIWVGGGVTFGPRKEKNYTKKLNKKMKAKALYCVLSKKILDADLLFLQNLDIPTPPRTKKAVKILTSINEKLTNTGKTLVVLFENTPGVTDSFANIPNINLVTPDKLNAYSAMMHTRLILVGETQKICDTLLARMNRQEK